MDSDVWQEQVDEIHQFQAQEFLLTVELFKSPSKHFCDGETSYLSSPGGRVRDAPANGSAAYPRERA